MRAGRLRHRLILQSKTETRDSYGASVVGWSTEATVWGSIEPLSGREYFSQQQVQAEARVRIVIRYRSDVDETWRIKHDGLYYNIIDPLNENTRDRMLILMCREGVSEDVGSEVAAGDALLLEAGDYLLLESGDKLLLEA
jgi:SPP1 family predicted phage head-tail adaptor